MTNPEKAKVILDSITRQLNKARQDYLYSNAELEGARASKQAYDIKSEDDWVGGFDPMIQRYQNNIDLNEKRSQNDLKNFEAWEEVYKYALEVFLDKIP